MRKAYIVSYDIADPKRLRKVFKLLHGFGDHIQLSVFRCELSDADRVRLIARLTELVHHKADQVLVIDLGLADKKDGDRRIKSVGRPYVPKERAPLVI